MKRILRSLLQTPLILATSVSAFAHDGHGHEAPLSLEHYLVNAEHAVLIALIVIGIGALTRSYFIKRSRIINGK